MLKIYHNEWHIVINFPLKTPCCFKHTYPTVFAIFQSSSGSSLIGIFTRYGTYRECCCSVPSRGKIDFKNIMVRTQSLNLASWDIWLLPEVKMTIISGHRASYNSAAKDSWERTSRATAERGKNSRITIEVDK